MNYNNPKKRYFENYDDSGPDFKRQRGSFRGNSNYNNPGRQNFSYGGGSYGGGQNFGRGGRGPYRGGRGGNRGGGRGFGRGGQGQRGGGRGFFPRGRFDSRRGGGSFPRGGRGGPRGAYSRTQASNVIEVSFPTLNCSYKELLTDVLENCGTVLRPRPISSTCSYEDVKEKLPLLKEIVIDGNKLNITVSSSSPNPLKKTLQLPEKYAGQTEEVKKFFGAESIEPVKSYKEDRYIPMHILTFASEAVAQSASQKVMTLNGFSLGLKVYYEYETLYSDSEDRTDMDSFDEKAKVVLERLDKDAEMDSKENGGDGNATKNADKPKIVKKKSAENKEEEVENEEEEAENEEEEADNEEEEAENDDDEEAENEDEEEGGSEDDDE